MSDRREIWRLKFAKKHYAWNGGRKIGKEKIVCESNTKCVERQIERRTCQEILDCVHYDSNFLVNIITAK